MNTNEITKIVTLLWIVLFVFHYRVENKIYQKYLTLKGNLK